jgi:hypothetical protein
VDAVIASLGGIMNKYICYYMREEYVVESDTTYHAQCKCATENRIPEKKQYLISVFLVEKDGKEVIHSTNEI